MSGNVLIQIRFELPRGFGKHRQTAHQQGTVHRGLPPAGWIVAGTFQSREGQPSHHGAVTDGGIIHAAMGSAPCKRL